MRKKMKDKDYARDNAMIQRVTNAMNVCQILVDSFDGKTEDNLDAADFKDRSSDTWRAVELARKVIRTPDS